MYLSKVLAINHFLVTDLVYHALGISYHPAPCRLPVIQKVKCLSIPSPHQYQFRPSVQLSCVTQLHLRLLLLANLLMLLSIFHQKLYLNIQVLLPNRDVLGFLFLDGNKGTIRCLLKKRLFLLFPVSVLNFKWSLRTLTIPLWSWQLL